MHDYLRHDLTKRKTLSKQPEIQFGHVIQAAIESGLKVFGHLFSEYAFIDVGSPENYALALKHYMIETMK